MKKYILIAFLINFTLATAQTPCSGGNAGGYPCDGLTLQSYLSLSQLGASSGNDSWGWTDPMDNKEYALVGLNNSTFFIDITDPVNPRRLGRLMTHSSNSAWRDVKVYNNHAFIVSEASNHGMQVFDLTRLRGLSTNPNRTFSEDAHYAGFRDAHNIIINEDTGVAYILGARLTTASTTDTVIFLDITTPTSPTLIDDYSGKGYTHDAQVVTYDGPDQDYQGSEILIGANEDEVVILDVTNKSSVTVISTITYPNFSYTHQGWFTEDKRFFLLGDETDEQGVGFNTKTIVLNLDDLDNPSIAFNYYGPTAAIDHNGYVRGNRFYQASYGAGMRIIKLGDLDQGASEMNEVDYFDTWPSSNSATFNGAWNVYPYFPSGNLIISNYNTGFFVVKDPNFDDTDPTVVCQNITATLDKSTGSVTITANDVDNGSTDNIGITGMSLSGTTTFSCADVGQVFNVTLTVEDDYGNTSSCVAQVTIAAETTQYNGGGSWTNGTPDIGSNAKIASNYDTGAGPNSSFDACTCEIDAGQTLTIQANDYINIQKDITVNGNLVVKHQGSVVQSDATASVVKNGAIDVELSTPPLKKRDFMILGSPMTAETRTGVFNNAYNVQEYTASNFLPHPSVPAGGTNFADDNFDDWNPANGSIVPGDGYLVFPQAAYNDPAYNGPPPVSTLVFDMNYTEGTLNNGTVTRPITFNGLGTNPDGTPNVLANPYASPIDASALIADNPLINEVYFWEHLTEPSAAIPGANTINVSMDDISMFNGTMGVPAANDPGTSTEPNGVISTGQGFAIKAFGAGSVSFTNSMRLTSGNTTLRTPEGLEKLVLKVRSEQYEIGSYAGIGFRAEGTPQLDENMDSNRLSTMVSLYSHLDDGTEQLGIQTRESFDAEIKIPMGFESQVEAETTYVFSIAGIEGLILPNTQIYLVDNQENIITDLTQNNYEFKSGKGTFNGRFTLQFEQDGSLGSNENMLNMITVYPNPTDHMINIYSPATYLKGIEVYDVRGRRLSEDIDDEQNSVTLNVTDLETGIYFVKINTEAGEVTKKIIKK